MNLLIILTAILGTATTQAKEWSIAEHLTLPWYAQVATSQKGGISPAEITDLCKPPNMPMPTQNSTSFKKDIDQAFQVWQQKADAFAPTMGCNEKLRKRKYGILKSDVETPSDTAVRSLQTLRQSMQKLQDRAAYTMSTFQQKMLAQPNFPSGSCSEIANQYYDYVHGQSGVANTALGDLGVIKRFVVHKGSDPKGGANNPAETDTVYYQLKNYFDRSTLPADCGARYRQTEQDLLDQTQKIRDMIDAYNGGVLVPFSQYFTQSELAAKCVLRACTSAAP